MTSRNDPSGSGTMRTTEPPSDVWQVVPAARPSAVAFALHDAKNMLGVVVANVEYLSSQLAEAGAPPAVADRLEHARASARRLSERLRHLLASLRAPDGPG